MKHLRLLLAALLMVVALLGVTAATAHEADCSHTSLTLYEGFNLTGDSKTICADVGDLNGITHTQSGNCDDKWWVVFGANDWDDCASSWKVNQNDHVYCIEIFGNPNGIFPLLEGGFRQAGYWSNFDGDENDTATSIRWSIGYPACGGNP